MEKEQEGRRRVKEKTEVEAEWEKGREKRKEEAKRRDLDGREDEGEWKARRRDALPCS